MDRSQKILYSVITGFWAGVGGILGGLYLANPDGFFHTDQNPVKESASVLTDPDPAAEILAEGLNESQPQNPVPDDSDQEISVPNDLVPEEAPASTENPPLPLQEAVSEIEDSHPEENPQTTPDVEKNQADLANLAELERLAAEWDRLRKCYPPDEAFFDDLARFEADWNRLAASIAPKNPRFLELEEKCVPFLETAHARRQETDRLADSGSCCLDIAKWKQFLTQPNSPDDFAQAAADLNRLSILAEWNQFVEQYGHELNRFAVSGDTAAAAVQFYSRFEKTLAFLPEWSDFTQRLPEWGVTAREIPIQSRILQLLHPPFEEAYLYEPAPYQRYYLVQAPKIGENRYYSDLFGGTKTIMLDESAVQTVIPVRMADPYTLWQQAAETIPDSLRLDDPSEWYRRWTGLLRQIRSGSETSKETGTGDFLLKYYLLKDISAVLAAGDWHFHRRLSVWEAYFTNGRIPDGTDFFAADSPQTVNARKDAAELTAFLPEDIFEVDKTSEELNEKTVRIAAEYTPNGWLDQDFCGKWVLRLGDDFLAGQGKNALLGDWFLFIPQEDGTIEPLCVGTMQSKMPEVRLFDHRLKRGMILFHRHFL